MADKKIKERLKKIKNDIPEPDPDQVKKLAAQATKNKKLLKYLK
jgi:hypothetical protein